MYFCVLKIALQKMFNKEKYESDKACTDILRYIFQDYSELFDTITPNGWENSQYVRFLHPTPEQSFQEYKRMSENIDRLFKEKNCNWKYFFPRMFLIDPKDYFNIEDEIKPEDYDPNKAILEEIEQKKKEDGKQKFQDELDEIHRKSYEKAKYEKPSKLVLAYKKVFGELPEGHPQKSTY